MHPAGEIALEPWTRSAADPDEVQLVRNARAGDRGAFEQLVERYQQQVSSVVRRILFDPDEQQDAIQDTFVQAYRNLRRFQGHSSLRTWIIRIAINVALKRRGSFWRRRVQLTDTPLPVEIASPDPHQAAEEAILQAATLRALDQLPEKLRLPLLLLVFEGLSGREVAEVLGWSESTVWTRIYTARRELKKKVSHLLDA
jgi:RNA polymerase sigma-70 factor (ECF subfamily)